MKRLLLFVFTLVSLTSFSQTTRTINVATAGTLSSSISAVDKLSIEELTLTGNLNGTDFRLIREMAGNDYLGQPTNGVLRKLDLSGANIVEGGEKYLDTDIVKSTTGTYTQMGGDFFHFSTQNNVLGSSIFAGCEKLVDVVLPKSITAIGNYVFWYCRNLESLVIQENVSSIGWSFVFGPHKLNKLVVADGNPTYSTPAGTNALMQGTRLILGTASTVIPAGTTVIGERAFADCNGLGDVTLPDGVTQIESNAFENSSLTKINMPTSLTAIGYGAFAVCWGLKSFTLPKSVIFIDGSAFLHCSGLNSLNVESGNPVYDSRDNCNAIIETATNKLVCGSMSTVIPKSVTSIGNDAFRESQQLPKFTIPDWITSIGERAFMFGGLTSVTIPKSVTSIGDQAFAWCNWLTSVTVEAETPLKISEYVFTDRQNKSLYVPAGCKAAYEAADYWKDFKEILETTTEDVITISDAGQSTWCSRYDLDFTDVEGLKAYTATGYNRTTGTIWLTRVKEVPAEEGILIIGTKGTYHVPHKTTTTYYVNMLVGTLSATTIPEMNGSYTNYYLSNGTHGVGFYKVNGTQAISANRAYLPLLKGNVSAGTRFIGLDFEDGEGTTAINGVKSEGMKDDAYYNLQGQRVNNPGKGLYIKNGKKVVIR